MSKKPSYISASQINQYVFCPIAYRYLYIDKVKKDEGNIYTAYGSAIHEALAFNFRQKIKSGIDLSPKEVNEAFLTFLEQEKNKLNGQTNSPHGDWETISLQGENMLHAYMKEMAPTIQPKFVEKEFTLQLKNFPITIRGFIDLIDVDDWIIDHKTAGKTTYRTWTQAKVNDSIQFTLYSAAFRKMFGREEKGIRADILPRENKPRFKQIESGRSEEEILRVLNMATTIEKIIETGIWIPNLANCGQCPFRDICPRQPIIEQ